MGSACGELVEPARGELVEPARAVVGNLHGKST